METVPRGGGRGGGSRLDALAHAPEAEVAAAALLALWPEQLPTAALLARVPTSAPESSWQRIALRLGTADAGAVLAWLQAAVQGRHRELAGGSHAAADLGMLCPAAR